MFADKYNFFSPVAHRTLCTLSQVLTKLRDYFIKYNLNPSINIMTNISYTEF
jgi:sulfur relay (sulfurtransferase) DsrC/TusE family protein